MSDVGYHHFRWRDSEVHLLKVDLSKHNVRPVMADEQFPFQGKQPALKAVEEGALACVAGGFNITLLHHLGVVDQPQHAVVLDREIWTTGIGGGGHGFLIGDDFAATMRNHIQVVCWRPNRTTFEINHINRGRDGAVVAFTHRGGTNEIPGVDVEYSASGRKIHPVRNKFYVSLSETPVYHIEGDAERRVYRVDKVSDTPLRIWPTTSVVLESVEHLGLYVGDEIQWVQRLGMAGVQHIVSGWPELLHNGENVANDVELDPHAPEGPDNWLVRDNPRTALGASEDGKIAFLCSVQGRVSTSAGMRLKELGTMLKQHGCANAVNTDGGGSVFMWLKRLGLVLAGTYNISKTLEGGRPAHFSVSVFPKEASA